MEQTLVNATRAREELRVAETKLEEFLESLHPGAAYEIARAARAVMRRAQYRVGKR